MLVTVSSLKKADKHLATGDYDALVSIGVDGKEHCEGRTGKDLLLDFWDVTPVSHTFRGGLPAAEDVVRLIKFGQSLEQGMRILAHCKQGRSRSTAAALVLYLSQNLNEEEACDLLFENFPKSQPNWHILAIADQLLDTNVLGWCRDFHRVKTTRRDIRL